MCIRDRELDYDTPTRTSLSEQKISGRTEPGASIVVDSSFVYNSIEVNQETGEFSFIAQFSTIGDNLVRFRAVKEGKQDSTIAFNMYYLPSIAAVSYTHLTRAATISRRGNAP